MRVSTDSGVLPQITCNLNSDCPPANTCSNGVCEPVVSCSKDEDCEAVGKLCHSTRGFCVQCDGRHDNECPPGQTCQFDFTCVGVGGSDGGVSDAGTCEGACMTRDDCADHLVCSSSSCCPPPSRCTKPEDCPNSAPDCNIASGFCFGGDSCSSDQDCVGKAGCPGNLCECDQPSAGQPGICRPRQDECQSDQDCFTMGAYDNKYCALRASPKVCLEAPQCTDDIDCSLLYLICDQRMGEASQGRCINGMACPVGNECPSTQTCIDGACVGKNCINTPSLCTATETCNSQTGRCEAGGTMSCAMDGDCPAGEYCNTTLNACRPGCRDNSDCPMGICNASHQCVQGAGALCGPCQSDADCPAGLTCAQFTKVCKEVCLGPTCTMTPQAMCVFFTGSC